SARPPAPVFFDGDLCVKCNICTAACPVASVSPFFPGPKAVGPQLARFWRPTDRVFEPTTAWCSGCGVCSRVCPHGVPVAEMNIVAKAHLRPGPRLALRDWGLSRPHEIARFLRRILPLARTMLGSAALRALADSVAGLARHAPLPEVAAQPFSRRRPDLSRTAPTLGSSLGHPRVAYFHGCSTEDYEPWLGAMAVQVLEHLGVEVEVPPQVCCGLPLQSNHAFDAARGRARKNLAGLHPWAERGMPIVGTSTSCTLALKHEYRAVLGLTGAEADTVAESTYDLFEYLDQVLLPSRLPVTLLPVRHHVLYHAPCQLRSHRIGSPALRILRSIPGLRLEVSLAECCGVAGTYGLKSERYDVARQVGAGLFAQASAAGVDRIVTDSETCRWWIEEHTGIPAIHPVEVLSAALGLPDLRPQRKPR
ncbi:MAG TPA: anaerobic glycerol-3-phosphate dehydrogenase subunit C, partial [Anaerolineales bacterium]|nr:anaerobic glycerol-3-phosphate dehydrogenase subunit C [Anaerolineales bacterium]